MMSIPRLKRIVASFGAALSIVLVTVTLAAASIAMVKASSGADPSDAFNQPALLNTSSSAATSWDEDNVVLLRDVDDATRDDIALMWRDTMALVERRSSGQSVELDRRFSPQLVGSFGAVPHGQAEVSIASHRLRVDFVSLDGLVIELHAVARTTRDVGGISVTMDESFEALLVLETSGWAIATLSRVAALIES